MGYINAVTCSNLFDYDKGTECDEPYDGGVGRKGLIAEFTKAEFDAISQAADKSITDIVMKVGKKMYPFLMKEDSGLAEIESTLQDSGSREKVDRFSFQAELQEAEHFAYFEQLEKSSRYWVVLIPLEGESENNTDRYIAFGHQGGLQNTSWKWTSGKRGEFSGFDVSFENKTCDIGRLLKAISTKYPAGNADLIESLLVEATV